MHARPYPRTCAHTHAHPARQHRAWLPLGADQPCERLITPSHARQAGLRAVLCRARTEHAMQAVGISPAEQSAIVAVLAAVLHLGNIALESPPEPLKHAPSPPPPPPPPPSRPRPSASPRPNGVASRRWA